ncbi:2-polyprenyl-3-methyl-6-methoxy-1,4-benzoquinone monooxygenase [Amphibiibacter pelophylacis]|uniref:2-polyprenyl-3-methyl-6-methoxy-1,4-benzoquinone monooxygenase n=1 Tax=Amphibiibacter pelophylacis TaxID=1799477 RepID=A0ACC6P426_9BURK
MPNHAAGGASRPEPRTLSGLDPLLASVGRALQTIWGEVHSRTPRPLPPSVQPDDLALAAMESDARLSPTDKALSGSLMRVNHVGEVCAQALYQAQALTARSPALRAQMLHAAEEEIDHLAWTQDRLRELGAHRSHLNPLWYAGSFALGLLAGRLGDARSLGFVIETERQVEAHLDEHMERLPPSDALSQAIVERMKADEARHADDALAAGGIPLPGPVKTAMRGMAKVMTVTAHRL